MKIVQTYVVHIMYFRETFRNITERDYKSEKLSKSRFWVDSIASSLFVNILGRYEK